MLHKIFARSYDFSNAVANAASRSNRAEEKGRGSARLSTQVYRFIAVSDMTSMSIVKQCHFLDSILDTQFTNEVLNNPVLSSRDLQKQIIEAD